MCIGLCYRCSFYRLKYNWSIGACAMLEIIFIDKLLETILIVDLRTKRIGNWKPEGRVRIAGN